MFSVTNEDEIYVSLIIQAEFGYIWMENDN